MPTTHIVRPALIAAALLLVPLSLMFFGVKLYDPGSGYETLNWSPADFAVMGALLFIAGLMIELAVAKFGKYRALAVAGTVLLFVWLWAELAVGVFTNWGS